MLKEYKIMHADVILKCDASEDEVPLCPLCF